MTITRSTRNALLVALLAWAAPLLASQAPADLDGLKAAAERGLITRALGDTLVFAPPLVINRAEVDEIVDKFALAVEDVLPA